MEAQEHLKAKRTANYSLNRLFQLEVLLVNSNIMPYCLASWFKLVFIYINTNKELIQMDLKKM